MHLKNQLQGNVTENTMLTMFRFKYIKRLTAGASVVGAQMVTGMISFFLYSTIIFNYFRILANDIFYINIFEANTYLGFLYLTAVTFTFLMEKLLRISRRTFILCGCLVAGTCGILASCCIFIGMQDVSLKLFYVYVFFVTIGMGPMVESYVEDILPEKGVFMLTMFKWLGYCILGSFFEFIIQYLLLVPGFLMIMFITNMLAMYVGIEMVQETRGMDPEDVAKLFGGEEGLVNKGYKRSDDHSVVNLDNTVAKMQVPVFVNFLRRKR